MAANKHIDFAVPTWGELAEGPTVHQGLLNAMLADTPMGLWVSPGQGTMWQDLSGNGHQGQATTSVLYQGPGPMSRMAITPGVFDRTVEQYVSLPWTLVIPVGSAISVELWTKFTTTPPVAMNGTFSLQSGSGSQFQKCDITARWSDGHLYWDYGNESTTQGRLRAWLTGYDNQWTHVVCVSSGAANSFQGIYINGQLAASKASSFAPSLILTGGSIGRAYYGGWRGHAGAVALAAVYTQMLPAQRIALRYQLGVQGS